MLKEGVVIIGQLARGRTIQQSRRSDRPFGFVLYKKGGEGGAEEENG